MAATAVVHRTVLADSTPRRSAIGDFGIRSFAGALGFVAGAAGGLGLAAATGPHHCNCDDPGLSEAVAGAFFGGVIGASFGASFPELSKRCSFGARMLRSAAGSVVGSIAVTAISANVGGGLIGWPIGAVFGASTALIGC